MENDVILATAAFIVLVGRLIACNRMQNKKGKRFANYWSSLLQYHSLTPELLRGGRQDGCFEFLWTEDVIFHKTVYSSYICYQFSGISFIQLHRKKKNNPDYNKLSAQNETHAICSAYKARLVPAHAQ